MTRAILRRLANLLPLWLGISLIAFALGALAPGDPAEVVLQRRTGEPPTYEAVIAMRHQLGLDAPLPVRYARWLGAALRGDLGTSLRTGAPVLSDLRDRFPATLELSMAALLFGICLALPLGIAAATRRGSAIDHAARFFAVAGASLPSFFSGYLLILVFAVVLHALPVSGRGGFAHLILPAVTLSLGFAAIMARLTRAALLDELGEDYVRTARAKGLPERTVVLRHALRLALVPVVTFATTRFGHLLAGAAIVETVFGWPGIGKHIVDSIYDRDYPAIQGYVLFMGTIFVALNLAVDLIYRSIDPRVGARDRAWAS
jgi:peptide/nickel transport system permease protein